jgi:hypothetical protein
MPEQILQAVFVTAAASLLAVCIWHAFRDWQPVTPRMPAPPVDVDAILADAGRGTAPPETAVERTDRIIQAASDLRYAADCDRAGKILLPHPIPASVLHLPADERDDNLVEHIVRVRLRRTVAAAVSAERGRHRAPRGQVGHMAGVRLGAQR